MPARPAGDVAELARAKAVLRERLDLAGHELSPRIDRFTVLERIGRGGMGVVYAVYDERLDRRVALKLIARTDSEQQRARVQLEARAMAKLDHPNVVSVFEVGEHEGQLFIVMEYVAGATLYRWQRDPEHGPAAVLDAYLQAARGLAAAHRAGIVHRDFKPDNAIVDGQGRVRVLDFGLARARAGELESSAREPAAASGDPSDTTLTETGALVGTPAYMSAEQFAGEPADHRADQFALCVALWEALAGERPFAGTTRGEIAEAVAAGVVRTPPRQSRLPGWMRPLLQRGLDRRREARFASMDALILALERGRRPRYPRGKLALAGAGLAVALAAAMWLPGARGGDACVDAESQLDPVWNERRRDGLHAALAAVDAPFTASVTAKVDAGLTEYGAAWIAGYRDACEAAHVHGTQSEALFARRVRCLEARRRDLGALLDVLETPDAKALAKAPFAVLGLPRIASCADTTYVSAEVLPPDDPEIAAEVAQMEIDIARGGALEDAGRHVASKELVQATLARAEQLGYAPMILDALNGLSSQHLRLGEYKEALAYARRAFVISDVGRLHARANTASMLGSLALVEHDYEQAVMHHSRALAMREAAGVAEDPDTAGIHTNLGNAYAAGGDLVAARRHFEAAVTIQIRVSGERHEYVALARSALASAMVEEGNVEEGLAEYRLALDIERSTLGDDHPSLLGRRINIAGALLRLGRFDEAVDEARVGLAAAARLGDDARAYRRYLELNLGRGLALQGELDEARELTESALAFDLAAYGEDHPELASTRTNLGQVFYLQGRTAEALEQQRKALALREKEQGGPDGVGDFIGPIGLSLAAQGDLDAAEQELRKALASVRAAHGDDVAFLAVHREGLAGLRLRRGDPIEALALLQPTPPSEPPPDRPTEIEALGFAALADHELGFPAAAERELGRVRALAASHPRQPRPAAVLALLEAVLHTRSIAAVQSARAQLAALGQWPFVALADRWLGAHEGAHDP